MEKNHRVFTSEEQEILMANPYTKYVDEHMIKFTLEFKKIILEKHSKGLKPKEIFIAANYDPKLLGIRRINDAVLYTKKQASSPKGLRETGPTRESILAMDVEKKQTKAVIKELQNRIAHLEQEISFLKKIQKPDPR